MIILLLNFSSLLDQSFDTLFKWYPFSELMWYMIDSVQKMICNYSVKNIIM